MFITELENLIVDLCANLRLSDLQCLQHVFHRLQRVFSFFLTATCKLNKKKYCCHISQILWIDPVQITVLKIKHEKLTLTTTHLKAQPL